MLTDANEFSSTAELFESTLLFEVAAALVAVVWMETAFGKNALSVAIDDKSVLLSTTSLPIAIVAEHDAVEANGSSVDSVATLTLLWFSGKLR